MIGQSVSFSHKGYRNMERAEILRSELKIWERAFAEANSGRKPGRDDIKSDSAIGTPFRLLTKRAKKSV